MEKIKGQNFRVTYGGKYIAFSTSCTLHIGLNLEDSSTKDSTGDWQEQEVTGKSWDGSVDALYGVDDPDTTGKQMDDIIADILAGQPVDIEFVCTQGTQNRVIKAGKKYTGKAIFNDFSLKAENKQNVTQTIQFQGTGELKQATATAGTDTAASSSAGE